MVIYLSNVFFLNSAKLFKTKDIYYVTMNKIRSLIDAVLKCKWSDERNEYC